MTESQHGGPARTPIDTADLCASGQQVRAVMAAADRDADRCAERIAELERLLDKARAEAKRMDLARDQFLGERNMLAEALRDIQRGDMTGMMELTEAEAAKARATWAIKRIGTPAASPTAQEAEPVAWLWLARDGRVRSASNDPPTKDHIDGASADGDKIIPVYAHPPHPSEAVAEATNHALDACRIIDAAVLEGHDNTSDLICHLLEAVEPARAALRALKGDE